MYFWGAHQAVCLSTFGNETYESVEQPGKTGAFLFIALFLFFWVTTSPYSVSLNTSSADPLAGNSNLINQIVTLLLSGSLLIVGLRSPLRSTILQPRILLCLLFSWYLIVSVLSAHSDIAVKRVVLAFMTCINAGVILLLPRSDAHFAKLLGVGALIMLVVAYFGVIFIPNIGIHQASDIREPMLAGFWRGQFIHKNAAAAIMVVGVFFGLFVYSSGMRLLGIAVVLLSAIFLFNTGGKTSSAALPAILIIAWWFEKWRWSRIPIAMGGIVAVNAVTLGSVVNEPIRSFVKSLGVDTTFTNRSDIWEFAISAIAKKPITGYGLQAFWQTSDLVYSGGRLETWAVNATSAHNAYVETLLSAGVPGLVLTLLWLWLLPLIDVSKAYASSNNPDVTRLFVRIWLYAIYTACVESLFFQSGSPLWFALMFSVFGLRLQARVQIVSKPD
ncbi:O-antigen ligase [Phyllobacterium myrsinacearum]|jgi:O-antigen ligase|uniref:Exopolysaccharide biosynthesis protein n=2 Tax=Phyllobacterium myrsinacearum TaxID=28101 RepID=A0A2S9JHN0_9HYPH|nr:exopolysaccharide biosynthesis protein [Phyllobacterium myrsinacearum]PWV83762.1 O-antigen ligase [Phyllobacterium myrsinacearum]RZV04715.1 O-antigen ligase [Phyllobacterium myrsinacearum]